MQQPAVCLFLLFAGAMLVYGKIPDGYVLQVKPLCGSGENDTGSIHLLTDLYLSAHAQCEGGQKFEFFSNDSANFFLPMVYTDDKPYCQMIKQNDTRVFSVRMFVNWGEPGSEIQADEERYVVTCSFNTHSNSTSDFKDVTDALVAPRVIESHMGTQSTAVYSLRMTDILGNDLLQPVDIGRLVKLVAVANDPDGAVGLRPVTCDAIGVNTNKRHAILRAGCGDGLIIRKYAGFVTSGLTATSPLFPAFELFNDNGIQFDCNFTLCPTNCDGSSCINDRRRRSDAEERDGNGDDEHVRILSDQIELARKPTVLLPLPGQRPEHAYTRVLTGVHWFFISLSLFLVIILVILILRGNFRQRHKTILTSRPTPLHTTEIFQMKLNP